MRSITKLSLVVAALVLTGTALQAQTHHADRQLHGYACGARHAGWWCCVRARSGRDHALERYRRAVRVGWRAGAAGDEPGGWCLHRFDHHDGGLLSDKEFGVELMARRQGTPVPLPALSQADALNA